MSVDVGPPEHSKSRRKRKFCTPTRRIEVDDLDLCSEEEDVESYTYILDDDEQLMSQDGYQNSADETTDHSSDGYTNASSDLGDDVPSENNNVEMFKVISQDAFPISNNGYIVPTNGTLPPGMHLVFVPDSAKEEFIKKSALCYDRYDRGLSENSNPLLVQPVNGVNGFVMTKSNPLNKVPYDGLGAENTGKLNIQLAKGDNASITMNPEYYNNQGDLNAEITAALTGMANNYGSNGEDGSVTSTSGSNEDAKNSMIKKHCKFECNRCDKRFKRQFDLNAHMRTHDGQEPYSCSQCGMKFNYLHLYRKHMNQHNSEDKGTECQECGLKIRFKSHVKVHMRTHTGEKPYKCGVCGRAFAQSCILTTHMRTHTGELFCKLCR
jgi:DNA-directed RNA polymerase subunit RPC12/RpoP